MWYDSEALQHIVSQGVPARLNGINGMNYSSAPANVARDILSKTPPIRPFPEERSTGHTPFSATDTLHRQMLAESEKHLRKMMHYWNHGAKQPLSLEDNKEFITALRSFELANARLIVGDYKKFPHIQSKDVEAREAARETMLEIAEQHQSKTLVSHTLRRINHTQKSLMQRYQKLKDPEPQQVLALSYSLFPNQAPYAMFKRTAQNTANVSR